MKIISSVLIILLFCFACAETQVEVTSSEVDFEFLGKWGELGNQDGQFYSPMDMAIVNERIYVVDQGNNRIQYFDLNGKFLGKWGEKGTENGQFFNPTGIAISAEKLIFITDSKNNRIQWFDLSGKFIGKYDSFGEGVGKFKDIAGIAAENGRIFFADMGNHQIKWFDFNGDGLTNLEEYKNRTKPYVSDSDGDGFLDDVEASEGTNPINGDDFPGARPTDTDGDGIPDTWETQKGLKLDDSSDAFLDTDGDGLTNLQEYRILTHPQKPDTDGDGFSDAEEIKIGTEPLDPNIFPPFIDTDGDGIPDQWEVKFGLNPADPSDALLDFDPRLRGAWGGLGRKEGQFSFPNAIKINNGIIYILDPGNSRIQWFDLEIKFLGEWRDYGFDPGQIIDPTGIDVYHDIIYIVDSTNHRIQGFNRKDSSFVYLNKCGCKGIRDFQFHNPYGIVIDPEGNIFVSDKGNNRIQKFRRK